MHMPLPPVVAPTAPAEPTELTWDVLPMTLAEQVEDEPDTELSEGVGLLLAQLLPAPLPLRVAQPVQAGGSSPLAPLAPLPSAMGLALPVAEGSSAPQIALPAVSVPLAARETNTVPAPLLVSVPMPAPLPVPAPLPPTLHTPAQPSPPLQAVPVQQPVPLEMSLPLAQTALPPKLAPVAVETSPVAVPGVAAQPMTPPVAVTGSPLPLPAPSPAPLPLPLPVSADTQPAAYLQVPFDNGRVTGQVLVTRPAADQPQALMLAPSNQDLGSHLRQHLGPVDVQWQLKDDGGLADDSGSQGHADPQADDEQAPPLTLAEALRGRGRQS